MKYKIWLIFMCIPLYPVVLIGEHYAAIGNGDDTFRFKEVTKDYWEVVWEDLTRK